MQIGMLRERVGGQRRAATPGPVHVRVAHANSGDAVGTPDAAADPAPAEEVSLSGVDGLGLSPGHALLRALRGHRTLGSAARLAEREPTHADLAVRDHALRAVEAVAREEEDCHGSTLS